MVEWRHVRLVTSSRRTKAQCSSFSQLKNIVVTKVPLYIICVARITRIHWIAFHISRSQIALYLHWIYVLFFFFRAKVVREIGKQTSNKIFLSSVNVTNVFRVKFSQRSSGKMCLDEEDDVFSSKSFYWYLYLRSKKYEIWSSFINIVCCCLLSSFS